MLVPYSAHSMRFVKCLSEGERDCLSMARTVVICPPSNLGLRTAAAALVVTMYPHTLRSEPPCLQWLDAGGTLDIYSDAMLARYCYTHKWNWAKIRTALRKTAQWQTTHRLDYYRAQFVAGRTPAEVAPPIKRYYACVGSLPALGKNRRGGPVEYLWVEGTDIPRILEDLTDDEYYNCVLVLTMHQLVWCDRLTLERGDGTLVGLSTIFDMKGITWANATGPMAKRLDMLSGLDQHTPGLVQKVHMVNCPGWAVATWNAVSLFMTEETRERTSLSKGGAKSSRITDDIDVSQLAAHYGGAVEHLDRAWCLQAGLDPELDELAIARLFRPPRSSGGRLELPAPKG